jgi:hypothetical protein
MKPATNRSVDDARKQGDPRPCSEGPGRDNRDGDLRTAEAIWVPDARQQAMLEDPDCRGLFLAVYCPNPFDATAAQGAFDGLIARHSMLRSHYTRAQDGRLLVVTMPPAPVAVSWTDLRSQRPTAARDALIGIARAFIWYAWDPYCGPLVGCTVARLSESLFVFVVGVHHSLADAASMNIMRYELQVLYRASLMGVLPPLEPIHLEYRDLLRERTEWLSSDSAIPHLNYWRRVLAGTDSLFKLPYDDISPLDPSAVPNDVRGELNGAVLNRLRDLAASQHTTLPTLFSALVMVIIGSLSAKPDVAAWICHMGRPPRKAAFYVVGCFVDYWLLRVDISHSINFVDALHQVHQRVVEATPHLAVTLHTLIPELSRISAGAIYPGIVINFMPYAKTSALPADFSLSTPKRPGSALSKDSPLGLVINCTESADQLTWDIIHSAYLWGDRTIHRFSSWLVTAAAQVAHNPQTTLADLAVMAIPDPVSGVWHQSPQ